LPKPAPSLAPKPAPTPTPTPPLTITTISLPNGDVGIAYSQTIAASGGSGTYTWSISAGSLPAGLSLAAATGVISGKPTTASRYNFTVRVAGGITTATQPLTINIGLLPLTITTTSLPNGGVGVAYSRALAPSGGSGIYTWSVSAGSLPAGLSLADATGVIAGTPTTAGTSNFTVRVADGITTATQLLSITTISPTPTITTTSIPKGAIGVAY
jgi:cytochrome bd-type quinol oxidase subunit 2